MPRPVTKRRSWAANRAQEPSTYAGLGALLASLLPVLPPQYQLVAGAIGAVAGAVAAFKRDPASQDHVERP